MSEESVLTVGAWLLILFPIFNLFFVRDGYKKYKADPGRSRILLALWGVKLGAWAFGVLFAIFSIRYLSDLPPFPFDGLTLIMAVAIIELLPVMIYITLTTYNDRHG